MAKGKAPVARIDGAPVEDATKETAQDKGAEKAPRKMVVVEAPAPEEPEAAPAKAEATAEKPKAEAAKAKAAPAKVAAKAKPAAAKKTKAKPKVNVTAVPSDPAPEADDEPKAAAATKAADVAPDLGDEEPSDAFQQARSIGRTIGAWLNKVFPGNVHAVLGGLCGLLVAVLFFVLGFWKTLFVCFLVLLGVALGQYLDGDPRIIRAIRKFITEGRGGN